jgi:hypothetical protein
MVKRLLIFVHRWLGVALCLLFLIWFPSGIGMMYWDYPAVSPADRLEHAAALDPTRIKLSPAEAAAVLGDDQPAQMRLNTFDGRPVYRLGRGDGSMVYADTGEEQLEVSKEMMDRIASSWTGQPSRTAVLTAVEEMDQWTLQGGFRNLRPVWKYTWPNGEQVYISELTGEVVQYTTTASRLGAYVGAIPHWFYFTPLRKNGPLWSRAVIWASGIGTCTTILGLVIGVWMYSPRKRYRYNGQPTSIPYRGQKRWHTLFGLVFGVGAATWAFSGMLSMDPFPMQRANAGGRRGGGGGLAQSLRARTAPLNAFAAKHPRTVLEQLSPLAVKELEFTSILGGPVYLAHLEAGDSRIVPLDGDPFAAFDAQRIIDVVRAATAEGGGADISVLDQYDRYYLDRRRVRPLPVVLAQLRDEGRTRYYIDLKTARIVGSYTSANWVSRWLYHGLHSFDFPWLYNYRPLWDIVVIAFMTGGTALAVTSLILAWRVLGRKLQGALAGSRIAGSSEDLTVEA